MTLSHNEHEDLQPSVGALTGHLDDWEELAVDYVDGQVDAATAAAVESHLGDCAACAERIRGQRSIIAFLEDIDFEQPPAGLEQRVFDALPSTSQPSRAARTEAQAEMSRWSLLWRRRIVPWIPATIGVVAVLAGIVTFGVLRADNDGSLEMANAPTTTAAAMLTSAERVAEGHPPNSEVAGGDSTASALGAGTVPAPGAESTDGTQAVAMAMDSAEMVQDRGAMISDLEAAASPAYFVFSESDAAADGGMTKEISDRIAKQVTALTGLEPVDHSLWIGGPTFAAYLPRESARQLVELLLSIGTSFDASLGLSWRPLAKTAGDGQPSYENTDRIARLLERKAMFPELCATRTPQPAVSSWTFTTATLPPASQSKSGGDDQPTTDGQDNSAGPTSTTSETAAGSRPGTTEESVEAGQTAPMVLPDEAGTHVLVVIYVLD